MGSNYISFIKIQRLYRWSLGMDELFHHILYIGCNHLSMLELEFVNALNPLKQSDAYMLRLTRLSLAQIIACRLLCDKALSEHFYSRKCIWKCLLENAGHLPRPQCVQKWLHHCQLQHISQTMRTALVLLPFALIWNWPVLSISFMILDS